MIEELNEDDTATIETALMMTWEIFHGKQAHLSSDDIRIGKKQLRAVINKFMPDVKLRSKDDK